MYENENDGQLRLDQGESASFLRQLEDIDTKTYARRYPGLIARRIVRSFASVADWASLYTWREWDGVGQAKVITDYADDFPGVDVVGKEFSQPIKDFGASYGFTIKEIKQSAATGVGLDEMRAARCRLAIETLIDDALAYGIPALGIYGLLGLDNTGIAAANRVGSFTLSTKAAGGVAWGTLLAPRATGQEMANDIIGICAGLASATKNIWTEFDVVLPIDQFNVASSTKISPLSDMKATDFALASPFVKSITPWFKCTGQGSGATDRMLALPAGDADVLAGIVPQEYTPQAPQLRNMKFIINASASCGGVIARYPVAMKYADGL